jgi:subtilisin family serine protease
MRLLGLATASVAVAFTGAVAVPTAGAAPDPGSPDGLRTSERAVAPLGAGRYVVVLTAPAASSYAGGDRRFDATRPPKGGEYRADSAAARAYTTHLRQTQDRVASSVGATAREHYTVALNGFAAQLTAKQAAELQGDKDVLLLEEDTLLKPDTFNTPSFLGLAGKQGVWKQHGTQKDAGAGTVVGVIDSGYWPTSPSFKGTALTATPTGAWDASMDAQGRTRMEKLDGSVFRGECETGQAYTRPLCSTKVVGARFYPDAYVASTPPEERPESEYLSPRDGSGHGSHTASTAAGNLVNGPVKVEDRTFGPVSGMSPGAAIAVYKVCFENVDPDESGCATSASVAAIDDAVADGVDVINFSISGAQDTVVDAVEIAFEGAAEAGVFIATSAGNSGPEESTVAHNSPWLTTVAAGTHYNFEGTVVLADGTTLGDRLLGASVIGVPLGRAPLVLSSESGVGGADATALSLCGPNTLDPAQVSGKIVICLRGTYDRVAKSAEVERAGGVGMILVNPTPNSTDADFHAVPTVHLDVAAGEELLDFMETATAPSALFSPGNRTSQPSPPLPQVAGFSSRGPALANQGDLLKPDITAPGQSVLAAVAPPSNSGRGYDLYSGTSMASPHVAGLAAFIAGEHPTWSPMEIKSAMMTTSSRLKNAEGGVDNDVFAGGAGQVDPTKFFDPGLFVTETGRNWRGFITGQGYDTGVPAVEASQLNVPSFADGAVTGSTTITRSFRASRAGTWRPVFRLPGFRATASPATVVSKRANDVIEVTFTFLRTTAPLDQYAMGSVTLTGPTKVRMPVAMKPVAVDAPASVSGEGTEGSVEVPVTAGLTGSVEMSTSGLAADQGYTDEIAVGDYYYDCWAADPESTEAAVFDVDSADDTADLDLVVYGATACDTEAIEEESGVSATGSADERVVLEDPEYPVYITEVAGYAAGEQGDPIPFSFGYYDIGGTPDLGGLTVEPNPLPVVQGEETSYEVSWSGLEPGSYLGFVSYEGSPAKTYLEVDAGEGPIEVRPAG